MWTYSKKKFSIKENCNMHLHFKGDKFIFLNSRVSWGEFPTSSDCHLQEVTHLTELSRKEKDHGSAYVTEKKEFWALQMENAVAQK